MKTLLILTTAFLFLSVNFKPAVYSLTVKVTNLYSTSGLVEIGLYNNADNFPEVGLTYKKARVKPKTDYTCTYTFQSLPYDNYAFAIYHDENSNNTCDVNFFGIPTEYYGFSNNVVPTWSAPSFNDCSFTLNENKTKSVALID